LDFALQEESNQPRVTQDAKAIIGGMITGITVKTTRTNSMMAFLTLEDMYGSVEIIVFPRDFEKNRSMFVEDRKVFIVGKVAVEEERPAKLILQKIIPFEQIPKQIWIQFENKAVYQEEEQFLTQMIRENPGDAELIIYCKTEKARKSYGMQSRISLSESVREKLAEKYKTENVKVVEKTVEKL